MSTNWAPGLGFAGIEVLAEVPGEFLGDEAGDFLAGEVCDETCAAGASNKRQRSAVIHEMLRLCIIY